MKLHLTNADGSNLITSYEQSFIMVNQKKYQRSLVLMPNALIDDWLKHHDGTHTAKTLIASDFESIAALNPEVVLLGTGATHQFLHPKIYDALTQKNIAVECMTTAAACRTYNILMSEGRSVAAALMIDASLS